MTTEAQEIADTQTSDKKEMNDSFLSSCLNYF